MVKWKRINSINRECKNRKLELKSQEKKSGKNNWKMSLAEFVRKAENKLLI